ncbi:MAG: PAS domain-containing protein [Candidatus Thorarchaeota archaeon]|jgi:PAS domain S-box-containing protein
MTQSFKRKPSPDRKPFRKVADTMHIPVVEFDEESVLCYANPPALELFKLEKEAIDAGVTVHDVVAPEQHDLVDQGLQLLENGESPTSISLRIIRGDGVKVPTQVYTDNILKKGKVAGYVVYIIDLSRRVAAEEKIAERKEILEFMVDYYSFSGIVVIDDKYKFEYVNDKM